MASKQFFHDQVRRLMHVLRRHGRTQYDAEDLIQEAFIRLELYQRSQVVREPEAFLVRAVRNLSIDKHRHDSFLDVADEPVDELPIFDTAPRPDEVYAARERLNRMIAGLDQLSEKTRDIFLAIRVEGKDYQQVAGQHKMTVSAVEKHIARALLHLSGWMQNDE